MADREPVDFAEDIGGLKADMKTVTKRSGETLKAVNEMSLALVEHITESKGVREKVAALEVSVESIKDDYVSKSKIKSVLATVALVSGVIGGVLSSFAHRLWNFFSSSS